MKRLVKWFNAYLGSDGDLCVCKVLAHGYYCFCVCLDEGVVDLRRRKRLEKKKRLVIRTADVR